eukprot:15364613-Ditylum_brightwellii.AAC.1
MTLDKKHEEWKLLKSINESLAGKEPLTYEKWKSLDDDAKPRISINVCYNMGWQKKDFCSLCGHCVMIGAWSRTILASFVSAKECSLCKAETQTRKKAKCHDCPKNHDGTSKAMESA